VSTAKKSNERAPTLGTAMAGNIAGRHEVPRAGQAAGGYSVSTSRIYSCPVRASTSRAIFFCCGYGEHAGDAAPLSTSIEPAMRMMLLTTRRGRSGAIGAGGGPRHKNPDPHQEDGGKEEGERSHESRPPKCVIAMILVAWESRSKKEAQD